MFKDENGWLVGVFEQLVLDIVENRLSINSFVDNPKYNQIVKTSLDKRPELLFSVKNPSEDLISHVIERTPTLLKNGSLDGL